MAVTEAEADSALRALSDPDRVKRNAVAALFGEPEGATAARKLLELDKEPADPVLLGALQVYAATAEDPAPLAARLTDKRPGLRVLAAQGLLARGDARGFPVLIDEVEAGVENPDAEWRNAAIYLARWTADGTLGPPLDADPRQRALSAERWKAWWAANKDAVRFENGRWSAA